MIPPRAVPCWHGSGVHQDTQQRGITVTKKVPVVQVTTPDEAAALAGLPLEATVAMADVAAAMREGLLAFATSAGLVVMQQMLTAELTAKIGAKHAKLPAGERVGNWHGTTQGQVVLGSQKITVDRPRGRFVDGGEIGLDTWDVFASEDLLGQVVVERMLAGVATRRHVDVAEPVGTDGKARSKSAVSRRFKAATQTALRDLMARDLQLVGGGGGDDRRVEHRRPDDHRRARDHR